jgi:mannosyl-oligosaccharide alpha-1,2-mannosidase
MEFKYLAHLTGRASFYQKVEHVMEIMYNTTVPNGLFPTKWDMESGTPQNTDYSVGAFADSGYEYLLKQWLMTGKSEPKSRDLYLKSATGIIKNLIFLSPKRKLLYVTDLSSDTPSHVFEHLSCFLPGLLALGAHTLDLSPRDKELHQWAAIGLAYTCYMTYADHVTGLGPDEMAMDQWPEGNRAGTWINHLEEWEKAGRPGKVPPGLEEVSPEGQDSRDYSARKSAYLLRPETVESFYILWKTTGDTRWRERGFSIFQAIEAETRTESGYASIEYVDISPSPMRDEMPSYFLAETLKYLYLLFSEEDLIPLDKWVFNTEGHPLPVYTWSAWEKKQYHIP